MHVLDATTTRLRIVLDAAVATNQAQCLVNWRDITATPTFTAGSFRVNTNGVTPIEFAAPPASSTQRVIPYISVFNADTAPILLTIRYVDAGGEGVVYRGRLLPNELVLYADDGAWKKYDAEGDLIVGKQTSLTIRLDEGATYTYVGEAVPGTAHAAASWRVKRITNADTTVLFADGNANFDNIWNDRATLTYA